MIGFLRGEVLEQSEGRLLLLVSGGASGIGYSVQVPQTAAYSSLAAGKTAALHIYTHVREDALDLYGFSSRSEKEVFLTLLSASGVGPKVALSVLSRAGCDELVRAIIENDKDALTQIPGIGKKTAERIVLELGDKIRKKVEVGEIHFTRQAKHPWVSGSGATSARDSRASSGVIKDAHDALLGLGYRDPEVSDLLRRVLSELETPPAHAQELVKTALRQLV